MKRVKAARAPKKKKNVFNDACQGRGSTSHFTSYSSNNTKHRADYLQIGQTDHVGHVDRNLPLWCVVQDLYLVQIHPTQETWSTVIAYLVHRVGLTGPTLNDDDDVS